VRTEPLRTAVIGLGRMGQFHLAALNAVAEVDVVAVAEPSVAALAAAVPLRPAVATYPDPAEALGHPGLEACLVATPTTTHPRVVEMALRVGLHVLCEKPLALDVQHGDRLGTLAAERGHVLQVGFWRRFSPPWKAAKLCIDRGDIGTPLMVRLAQWDADPPPPAFCDPAVSGGLAVDCGVHEYDLAEWFTGQRITRVHAWSLPIVDEAVGLAGDVDNLVAVLELHGGGAATVDLSRNSRFGDDVRTEVLGSDGALLIESLPTGRTRIGSASGLRVVAGSETDDVMAAGVAEQARVFAAAASGRATLIGQAVIEAARVGRPVDLPGA
jgi:predicted dehydrogenase